MKYYSYSISGDFPSGYDGGLLHEQLEADGTIGSLFVGIAGKGDVVKVRVSQALTAGEKTTLDGLIAAHAEPSADELSGEGNIGGLIFFRQVKLLSQTASKDTWKQKVVLELKDLVAGKYRIEWNYAWRYSTTARQFMARVTVDGTAIWNHLDEPKEINNCIPAHGKLYETLTAGDHTVVIEFKTSKNGDSAYMENAVLEVAQFRE
jgi:hypothetical protein